MKSSDAELLERRDKRYLWHPFTQMKEWCEDPIVVIEKGDGHYLIDTKGKRYLDGVSSLWCNVHGHRVKEIDEAITAQLQEIAHSTLLGLSNVPAILLAKELIEIAPPGLSKVFYSDSGSEAVEIAVKMAYQYWQFQKKHRKKKLFLKLRNAYHGDTLGAVSVGGIELFHEVYRHLLFPTIAVDAPYWYRDSFCGSKEDYASFCAAKVETILKVRHEEMAALIIEPKIQGAAGMLDQPPGYLARVRAMTKKYNVLLIADEVATGFGRTGEMFACEHEKVAPDFLCVTKGLTGGYLPLSATLTTQKIYEAFLGKHEEFKTFFHGHTYTGNPLACAAALANLKIFRKEKTLSELAAKIKLLTAELTKFKCLESVGDIRQAGFMAGIELVKDRQTKAPYPAKEKKGVRVALRARRKGVLIRPLGNVIVIMPPLSIKDSELRRLCKAIHESIYEEALDAPL